MSSTTSWESSLSPRFSRILTREVPVYKDFKYGASILVKELIPKAIEALKEYREIVAEVGEIDGKYRWYNWKDDTTYTISRDILDVIERTAMFAGVAVCRSTDTNDHHVWLHHDLDYF